MDRESSSQSKIHYLLTTRNIPFRHNKMLIAMIVVFILFFLTMAISPANRKLWLIENMLPIGVFIGLVVIYKKFRFSNVSYLFMFIFLCLHLYAAHYSYDKTPFDLWLKAVYHVKRSYMDRVVHFAFGLFWTYPVRELLFRMFIRRGFWSYTIPVSVVLSLSALYEIVEMFAALFAGQLGVDYIGLQGDIYDTQRDMSLALLGGVISMGVLATIVWRIDAKKTPSD